jgi:hypothetical protein
MLAHHPRPRGATLAALVAALALVLTACAAGGDVASDDAPPTAEQEPEPEPDEPELSEPEPDEPEPEDPEPDEPEDVEPEEPDVDPAEVGADELGVVPVLMYHQLRDGGGSAWDMSPEEFRAELTWLFDNDYVPITTAAFARGEIDVPAGYRPVVLTFDDSTRSQAYLDEDGEMAPDTSMGILIDVAADYDHVEPVASLYVITSSLFGGGADGPDIVAALHDLGMEIGNHSHTHANLRSLDAAGVQAELAQNVATVRDLVPGADVTTLSLPLGIYPDDTGLAVRGSADGVDYEHDAVLQVGYTPATSPFHAEFDGASVARIQTHPDPDFEFGSTWWLAQMEAGGSWSPYVSDGNPDTISFPADRSDDLHPDLDDRANPY